MNNLIAFFEIPTVDFYRAINFYETILGLKLSVFECETEKMACFIEQGGKIIIPKTKIEAENKGYFAVLEDSEGNHVGIYEK